MSKDSGQNVLPLDRHRKHTKNSDMIRQTIFHWSMTGQKVDL